MARKLLIILASIMCTTFVFGANNAQKLKNLTINFGEEVKLTQSLEVGHLVINGSLVCDEKNADPEIILKARSITVNGTFQCGSKFNRYDKKIIISLTPSLLDPKVDHRYRGLVVLNGGKLELYGSARNTQWLKLAETLEAGDTALKLDSGQLTKGKFSRFRQIKLLWSKGDKIVVAPTGYNSNESETFTILDIDPVNYKITLDRPATYHHYGEKQELKSRPLGTFNLDERAEVANLTRSIVIRGDESYGAILETDTPGAELGGHIMLHHGGAGHIDGVEFYKMGQAGVMARYPFHWHFVGDGSGQFVKNSSIHHSYQRCLVIHRTQNVDLINNVCYNFKGHGYFLEDGNETGNRIIKNLAISSRAPYESKVLLQSDSIQNSESQGRFPSVSGFWISNPDNHITHNVVAGSVGSGFWMSFEREIKDFAGNVVSRPLTTDTDKFDYNTARSTRVGMTWDGAPGWQNANNPNNPHDRRLINAHYAPQNTPVFRGNKAYKNLMTGIYFRGQTAVFKNTVIADSGWGAWVSFNQIFQDSVFVGKTQNTSDEIDNYFFQNVGRDSRYRRNGITLYDGPFEVHSSDFLNFSTTEEKRLINGREEIVSYVPFTSTGGHNKLVNVVSDLDFAPEPFFRLHSHSKTERWRETPILVNSSIRDLDGSLTGKIGGILVGKRSLALDNRCQEAGETFKNHFLCDETFTEGSLSFMRWGGGANAFRTPFVVRREDGLINFPIEEWGSIRFLSNNIFTTPDNTSQMLTLLPYYQYHYDHSRGTTARIQATAEFPGANPPILNIKAYGYNCSLNNGALEVQSLDDLYAATQTSYYSNEEHFLVRVIPTQRWRAYTDSPYIKSNAVGNNLNYSISCEDRPIENKIIGEITSVTRTFDNTIVEGWSCNYGFRNSIFTELHIGNSNLPNGLTYLGIDYANNDPDEELAFRCGSLTSQGRKFQFMIPNSVMDSYHPKSKIYVKGRSNNGGNGLFIKGSGVWSIQGHQFQTSYEIKR